MTLQYEKAAGDFWAARVHFKAPRTVDDPGVDITIGGRDGEPDAISLSLAEKLSATLSDVQAQVTAYLDKFVDRSRIDPAEWWLNEIEIERSRLGQPTCRFRFSLGNDERDWFVDIFVRESEYQPYRLERYDGTP